jgi:Protein of unknown function (DUF3108)
MLNGSLVNRLHYNFRTFALVFVSLTLAGGLQTKPGGKGAQPSMPTVDNASRIVPAPPNYRFPNSQTLVYGVEWHLFNAGTTKVRMDTDRALQRVTATADSAGMVNVLYSIHDRFEAHFDARTFCSQRVSKHIEEGPHRRDTQIEFDYRNRKSRLNEKNLKTGEVKTTQNDIPPCVTDVVTGFYYLAAQPLQLGNSYVFPMNDGGKTTDVIARVETREQVKVPAGAYQALRVTAEPESGALKGRAKVTVWFSETEHTPVQMRSKLGWGTLFFRLLRIEK